MGKASRRKREPLGVPLTGLHERIKAESLQAHEPAASSLRDATETPALALLLEAAREAIGKALPKQVQIEGRTYWLRCSIGAARVEVFDGPAMDTPMFEGLIGGSDTYGHRPFN
jgi:hypothetical protein